MAGRPPGRRRRSRTTPTRAWFAADLAERQALILRDIGTLGHYVGDGSQPLHVSIHYNGWGDGPNPEGFTQSRIHAMFEGAFVHDNVRQADVTGAVGPSTDCHCAVAVRAATYLAATNAQTAPLYRLQRDGAFVAGDPRGKAFVVTRLAAGATELRDLIVLAWRTSVDEPVGWPAVKPSDVIAGGFDPYDSMYGSD